MPSKKPSTSEKERIEQLVSRKGASIRSAFRSFVNAVQSPKALEQVREMLQRNRVDEALAFADQHVIRLADTISGVFVDTARSETVRAASRLAFQDAAVAISFNPVDPRTVLRMQQNRLRLVRGLTAQQRSTTRSALVTALRDGQGPAVAARAFRNSIGLTGPQWQAVQNYQAALERGDRVALQRENRDRRSDRAVNRAIEDGEPLGADMIERLVGRYTNNFRTMRGETIARTESHRIVNEAQQEAFQQITSQVQIPDDMIEREWVATDDERTRDTHVDLDGQVVQGLETPFVSSSGARMRFPGDSSLGAPAEETINCRCSVLRRIKGGSYSEDI